MADNPAVLCEHVDHIGVLTLNRPDGRNSMTPELLESFDQGIDELLSANPRAVVIAGSGRCFSAGADFNSQIQTGKKDLLPHERSFAMYKPFLKVLQLECPVIAALNGHAVGGGFGLALVCDLRVGNEASKYGANFVRLGLHPGMAISYTLPRIVGQSNAADLLLTGRLVSGKEAHQMGFLNRCVPGEQVFDTAMELAKQIAANAPAAVRTTKKTLYELAKRDVEQAAYVESFRQAESLQTEDSKEGIAALLEKRDPVFKGH